MVARSLLLALTSLTAAPPGTRGPIRFHFGSVTRRPLGRLAGRAFGSAGLSSVPRLAARGCRARAARWSLCPGLNRTHPCPDAGAASPETEHARLRFLHDDDLGVRLGDAELVEGGLNCFLDRPAGHFDPLHGLLALSRSLVSGAGLWSGPAARPGGARRARRPRLVRLFRAGTVLRSVLTDLRL